MDADAIYTSLIQNNSGSIVDPADCHVLACIFAIAAQEAAQAGSLAAGLGLGGSALRRVIDECFPGSLSLLEHFGVDEPQSAGDEEASLRELLQRFSTRGSAFSGLYSTLIARRSMRPNHLWQDLGLIQRSELSALMNRHFAPLARRNSQDMKWKKFFYRMICREDGFTLCAAPVCRECTDFETCFGDESGESLLARNTLRLPWWDTGANAGSLTGP